MSAGLGPDGPGDGLRLAQGELEFRFDGVTYVARAGDSAASALHRAGVRVLNRSIKYRRPRGLQALGPEEPNALLTVGALPAGIPNVSAPLVRVMAGMELTSQNRWPSLRFDVAATLFGPLRSLLGAGFYYKTFMWPSWRTYEGLIRRLAGLGYAPERCNLPRADVRHLGCDVLVAGGGPAGIASALTAARAGARVILCEREPVLGGELEFERAVIDGLPAHAWIATTAAEIERLGGRILLDTAVLSVAPGIAMAHRQPTGMPGADTLYRLHAPALIHAMGAVEHGIAFIDNDRPGVMLSGAADRLLARYGVRCGNRVVLFGNHNRLYATAQRLRSAGVRIEAIVDTRAAPDCASRTELLAAGVTCLAGHLVTATRGRPSVHAVLVATRGGTSPGRWYDCDSLLVSGGWSPAVQATVQGGGRVDFRADLGAFTATGGPDGRLACGAADGVLELASVLVAAATTGLRAAEAAGGEIRQAPAPFAVTGADAAPALEPFWRCPARRPDERRQFVDQQNDVTVADLRQAIDEGFVDIEHVKRYTTLGVGTEQGRLGGTLGAAIVGELTARGLAEVGLSRSRDPFQPVPMMALSGTRVGPCLRPARQTPLHAAHVAAGAEVELMSGWLRPRYYRANGIDAATASVIEAARVRQAGGVCDGSTLGKIEIAGPDVATFLDRLYLSPPSALAPGRARYAVLLREDGCVLDDGLVLRLAQNRYVVTTSSAHLPQVLSHLEFYRDTEFRGRRVGVIDVTEAWSVIIVGGPPSRPVLRAVLGARWDAELRDLPHLGVVEGEWQGAALRIIRATFTGELGYELHCRAPIAAPLWDALVEAGLAPFGLEALDVLRVEKGYVSSSELNGQTAPADVGFERMLRAGTNAIGRALLDRPAFGDPDRPTLVGLRPSDEKAPFLAGAQLTLPDAPRRSVGYVTSSVYSPQLRCWVGLALVARRCAGPQTLLVARDPLRSGDTLVHVVSPAHVDAAGERLRA